MYFCDRFSNVLNTTIIIYSRYLLLASLFLITLSLSAQETATVFGIVTEYDSDKPIEYVTVYMEGTSNAVETDRNGQYSIKIDAGKQQKINFSRIGYKNAAAFVPEMAPGTKRYIKAKMVVSDSEVEVTIRASKIEDAGMVREEVSELKLLPTTSGNFESVLPHIALGASSGSGGELSSQYNVRGGNYDENLVYVNDFEIFRPQLIRSGQQEGLTFPNIDMIRDLSFSSGGFDAKYGDKMSSVLDIRYKRPDEFRASIGASLLGGSAHIEGSKRLGANIYNKLRYMIGARYKTSRYLLGSLDTRGEYTPNFTDVQAYVTYDITRDLQLGYLGNFNQSNYNFVPKERSTALGLIDFALQLTSVFEGSELDEFTNGMNGLSLTFVPERDKNPLYLKLLGSVYSSNEEEKFDILGFYRLAQIETSLGSDNFGTEIALLGTGTQHSYARNYLYSRIYNIEHKGGIELQLDDGDGYGDDNHFIQWGVKYQNEFINDQINEWERLDSAGYSIPYDGEFVTIRDVLKTENELNSSRITGFVQNTFTHRNEGDKEIKITAGVRASHWNLNKETIFSPRAQILYKPLSWDKEISFKLAGGIYYQPPFYRELRRFDGTVNTDLKSQKSIHVVGGLSYDFIWKTVSDKPFRLITELYYKKLDNLVSYEIDNVRIRYSGENNASGYIAGIDLRVNGEFVPGAESWVNLSFLKAKESITDITHLKREIGDSVATEVKYVPRPTDQFMTLNIFFQDYLPSNENFKMHLNLSFGTGLPFGVKGNNDVYRNTYRYKAYHRVDIGFAYQLWKEGWLTKRPRHPLRWARNAWLSLEVFNLMQVSNVASNTWIKTITNTQYAIPNNLTSRRINLKFKVEF